MTVRFACPNGHGIVANDSMIGKVGKCPKCESKFTVPDPDEMIVFLCPNGHKLNGPRSLQGKPGQCPHCGSKFRIPVYDDESDDELAVNEGQSGFEQMKSLDSAESSNVHGAAVLEPEDASHSGPEEDDELPVSRLLPDAHPLARAVAELWPHLDDGPLEFRLKDASILIAESISLELSQESHAVIAVHQDGALRAIAIGWDQVERVVFPALSELPDELFL